MEKTITVNITEKINVLGLDWDESVLIQFTLPEELSVEGFLDDLKARLDEVKKQAYGKYKDLDTEGMVTLVLNSMNIPYNQFTPFEIVF